ncbi:glycine zipper 2TM domain-containing protein [Massilia sp. CFBP9012]|uniref:glycine zipper 2TM domain-containing protein n=1 Tax=Massilia sp. CFBP9012 TaxID=3096531 RepID=UPI002A6B5CD8|nr:glycine zipper 2TM domain-containing protein [Massilia sp. CFBP9012]MDY0976466.1 glycine zipper 2TM domain-containing protein [Massilia sp. CFBP9012]
METTTTNRIHPLMAAAAASVIVVSLTGAAAITGLLPTSKSAPEPSMPLAAASPYAMPQAGMQVPAGYVAQPGQMAPVAANGQQLVPAMVPAMVPAHQVAYAQPVAQVQPQPTVIIKEKPVVKVVEKTRVVHAKPQPVRYEEPRYSQPAPAQQPNYVGIGTGAVIGGLIGNQVGGGNGKKLATVAGVIGGGIIGNEIANRNSR